MVNLDLRLHLTVQMILIVTTAAANIYLINVKQFTFISSLSPGTYLFDLRFVKIFLVMALNLSAFVRVWVTVVCGFVQAVVSDFKSFPQGHT